MPDNRHWVGTWTVAPAPAEGVVFSNQTLRMNGRVSLCGDQLRVRISTAHGHRPLQIGGAYIGLRDAGSGVVARSHTRLMFGGAEICAVAAGAFAVSDPVAFEL